MSTSFRKSSRWDHLREEFVEPTLGVVFWLLPVFFLAAALIFGARQ